MKLSAQAHWNTEHKIITGYTLEFTLDNESEKDILASAIEKAFISFVQSLEEHLKK